MQKIFYLFMLLFIVVNKHTSAKVTDTIVDQRDKRTYKIVKIGDQIWMAENLNFKTDNSYCYENNDHNCESFGRLYTWEAAKEACPSGWHLPSDAEWKTLEQYLGMKEMDLNIYNEWRGTDQGRRLITDSALSFNLVLGGYRNPPSNYNLLKSQTFLWTSTEDSESAWLRQIYEGSPRIFRRTRPTSWAFSVRCVKD